MTTQELNSMLEIRKIDNAVFRSGESSATVSGHAFFIEGKGYLRFTDQVNAVKLPYMPMGGEQALLAIVDNGGLLSYSNIEFVNPAEPEESEAIELTDEDFIKSKGWTWETLSGGAETDRISQYVKSFDKKIGGKDVVKLVFNHFKRCFVLEYYVGARLSFGSTEIAINSYSDELADRFLKYAKLISDHKHSINS